MHTALLSASDPASAAAYPFVLVTRESWRERALPFGEAALAFAAAQGFDGAPGSMTLLPDGAGGIAAVLAGTAQAPGDDSFVAARSVATLPAGVYRLENEGVAAGQVLLGLLLGLYRFTRYKTGASARDIRFVVPDGVDSGALAAQAEAVAFGRDLINTPANDLGPADLEESVRDWAERLGLTFRAIVGDTLLDEAMTLVHAVGRASTRAPRLIDVAWGDPAHPRVTLVGKGVCFDTGGLNIKPDSGMLLMKKDMGGAATALAAAQMIVQAGLPVRLRVLIPAVENSISGSSFRPGDVLPSRKGLTVEIGNTDAEGRLILADALALAGEEAPDLVIDFATLTGAARVALGPDLPPFYTDDDALADAILEAGTAVNDPVWRMPLWPRYESLLDSKIADVNHISGGPFAGSVTAALFLRKFAGGARSWAHFDIFGWVPSARPGRPEGGEPQAARLVQELLRRRYDAKK